MARGAVGVAARLNGSGSPALTHAPVAAQPRSNAERLSAAFEAADMMPALGAARDRLIDLTTGDRGANGAAVTETIESDPALTAAVLRATANHARARASVPAAVDVLGTAGVRRLALSTPAYEPLEPGHPEYLYPERLRLHAEAVRTASGWLAQTLELETADDLAAAAVLHDVGRVILARLLPEGFPEQQLRAGTPEARLTAERRELGIDHALAGGVLARRWQLPASLATAIELHHSDDAEGIPALVGLADMLAHYLGGRAVSRPRLLAAARRSGLGQEGLRRAMHELPVGKARRRSPCPLSSREMDVLRLLAEGKVYKQIARALDLSPSTVRTHLHNVYGKLGAVDRAQAVLMARDRGWI